MMLLLIFYKVVPTYFVSSRRGKIEECKCLIKTRILLRLHIPYEDIIYHISRLCKPSCLQQQAVVADNKLRP